jgi:hypothetical protein
VPGLLWSRWTSVPLERCHGFRNRWHFAYVHCRWTQQCRKG